MPGVSKDQISRAKEVNILDYLRTYEPFNIKKIGNAYYLKDIYNPNCVICDKAESQLGRYINPDGIELSGGEQHLIIIKIPNVLPVGLFSITHIFSFFTNNRNT